MTLIETYVQTTWCIYPRPIYILPYDLGLTLYLSLTNRRPGMRLAPPESLHHDRRQPAAFRFREYPRRFKSIYGLYTVCAHIYIYMCVCVCVHVYMYTCMHIYNAPRDPITCACSGLALRNTKKPKLNTRASAPRSPCRHRSRHRSPTRGGRGNYKGCCNLPVQLHIRDIAGIAHSKSHCRGHEFNLGYTINDCGTSLFHRYIYIYTFGVHRQNVI